MGHEKVSLRLPLMGQLAHAGFPSPADDYVEAAIDLNEVMISNPISTFLWRVSGECMVDAKIFHDDIIVVDRSVVPTNGSIVVAVVDGAPTVKRFLKSRGKMRLKNENKSLPEFRIDDGSEIEIWGTVAWTLRDVRP